jgi:hypothetical protein
MLNRRRKEKKHCTPFHLLKNMGMEGGTPTKQTPVKRKQQERETKYKSGHRP